MKYSFLHSIALVLAVGLALVWTEKGGFAQRRIGESIPQAWQDDAELTDVDFVDANNGWAVGDHGTLLRTTDGGKTWTLSAMEIPLSSQQTQVGGEMQKLLSNVREQTGGRGPTTGQTIRQGLDVRLESVSFANQQVGIAVGGYHEPYTNLTRGFLLRTENAGLTWRPLSGTMLPKLNRVDLRSLAGSWALGHYSHTFESAGFETYDQGLTWNTSPVSHLPGWRDGVRTEHGWVLLGNDHRLYHSSGGAPKPAVVVGHENASFNQIAMQDQRRGWAVGDLGAIVRTEDGGETWFVPVSARQRGELESFDFQAVTVVGDRAWVAGAPGTRVFCLDGVRELESYPTGHLNRWNALCMLDEQRGWVVGSRGTILHTEDGGATWSRQRGASDGLSLLAVGLDSDSTAWETICKCSTAEGFQSMAVRLNLTGDRSRASQHREAAGRLGAVEARYWAIDLSQATRFGSADKRLLLKRLVGLIRETEPRVIVADAQATRLPSGAYVDAFLLLDEAIRLAADSKAFPEQLSVDLKPWQVDRLAVPQDIGTGQWRLDLATFLPPLGTLLNDEVALCRALVHMPLNRKGEIHFRVQSYRLGQQDLRGSLFAGLIESGRSLPRRDQAVRRGNLQDINNTMQKSEVLKSLERMSLVSAGDQLIWEQQLVSWLQWVDRETAGVWLAQLVDSYFEQGKLREAMLTLDFLATQYPDHPLQTVTLAIMAHYVSSLEVRIASGDVRDRSAAISKADTADTARLGRPPEAPSIGSLPTPAWQPLQPQVSPQVPDLMAGMQLPGEGSPQPAADQVLPTDRIVDPSVMVTGGETDYAAGDEPRPTAGGDAEELEETSDQQKAVWKQALQQLVRLRQRDPELAAVPRIKALEAHVLRNAESWEVAANPFRQLGLAKNGETVTRTWALQEIALHGKTPNRSGQMVLCRLAESKPKLDGQLDDAVWQTALEQGTFLMLNRQPLSPQGQPKTDYLIVAYDEDHLYIALRCSKWEQASYVSSPGIRRRDPDLEQQDRVLLSFDVDRDGGWPLQIGFGAMGDVGDGCGASINWNPKWYVGNAQSETHWLVEAAIPWSELSGQAPAPSEGWRLGLTRRAPRRGENQWDTPTPRVQYQRHGTLWAFPTIADDHYLEMTFLPAMPLPEDRK